MLLTRNFKIIKAHLCMFPKFVQCNIVKGVWRFIRNVSRSFTMNEYYVSSEDKIEAT